MNVQGEAKQSYNIQQNTPPGSCGAVLSSLRQVKQDSVLRTVSEMSFGAANCMRILYAWACDALTSSVDHGDGPTATRAVLAGICDVPPRYPLGGFLEDADVGAVREV